MGVDLILTLRAMLKPSLPVKVANTFQSLLVHGAMGMFAEVGTKFIVKLVQTGYLMATFIVMIHGDAPGILNLF
jgi:hypothetical protein